jgi:hypothetical protein
MAEIEVYENDIEMYLDQFMIDNNIDDLRSASQSVWNACLMYICRYVFKGTDKLKSRELHEQQGFTGLSTFGAYDYEKVNSVCDYYIYLCTLYDKEISQIGFSNLTGINLDTLNQWGNENVKSSKTSTEIYKKLVKFREESLSNKLATGNKNPVGILAILNRHYQWNLPGVSRENNQRQALTAADLPRLGGSGSVPAAQIEGNVSE